MLYMEMECKLPQKHTGVKYGTFGADCGTFGAKRLFLWHFWCEMWHFWCEILCNLLILYNLQLLEIYRNILEIFSNSKKEGKCSNFISLFPLFEDKKIQGNLWHFWCESDRRRELDRHLAHAHARDKRGSL